MEHAVFLEEYSMLLPVFLEEYTGFDPRLQNAQAELKNAPRADPRASLERPGINEGRTKETKRGQHVWFERPDINEGFTDPHARYLAW